MIKSHEFANMQSGFVLYPAYSKLPKTSVDIYEDKIAA